MDIRVTDPGLPQVQALLRDYHAYVLSQYPQEACFLLDIDALRAPGLTFLAAWEDERCLGTGALRGTPDYAELKSMYTTPDARGKGVAGAMVARLEATAQSAGRSRIMIETGPKFVSAIALYERAGYRRRGAFGDYTENPYSIFYEKSLPSLA